jgi:acetyltransferase-like isoleucine patch superfamily enzyme
VMIHGAEHVSIGDNTWIDRNVTLIAGPAGTERVTQRKPNPDYPGLEGELSIGANTHLSIGVVVCAIGGVHIGACSGIASYSAIYSFSHHYRNGTDRDDRRQFSFTPRVRPDQQSMVLGPVFIGDHTAVGLQATILPGSSLRTGAWVASGVVFQGVAAEQQVISASAPVQAKPIDHLHILR